MHLNISDFDIPQTFKTFVTVQKLAPVAQYTQGRFSTDIKLNSILDKKMEPLMNSLNGEGTLQTRSVVVTGFEPLNKLADALKMEKFKKADFSDLKIHYSFKDGKVSTDEFPFKSGSIGGFLKGSTSFDQTIDYTMKMEVPTKDMPDGAKQYVNGLLAKANMLGANAKMPDKVKLNALFGGTVTKPTVKTDVKEIQKEVTQDLVDKAKDVINQKKDSVIKDVKKDVSAEADKILKDAQADADKVKADAKTLSDQVKKDGYAQAQSLEDQAKNPLAKIAAKKAADKLRKETDDKAAKIITDGDQKADDIMKAAHDKADKLK
jgi:vacuolar-type H+-ATPase subunit H